MKTPNFLPPLLIALFFTLFPSSFPTSASAATPPALDITGQARAGGALQFDVTLSSPGPARLIVDLLPGPTAAIGKTFGVGLSSTTLIIPVATELTGHANFLVPLPVDPVLDDLTVYCEVIDLTSFALSGAKAVVFSGLLPGVPGSDLYFVDGAFGNDGGSGRADAPWKTIQKAADSLPAGSTAVILSGVYPERVVVRVSGDVTAGPVIFRGHPSGRTIIDGGHFGDGDFAGWSGAFGLGLVDITDRTHVRLQDLEIRGLSTASKNHFIMGVQVGKTAANPSPMDLIELVGLDVHDITYTGGSDEGGAQGIAFYGGHTDIAITGVKIVDCEVHDLRLGQSEAMTLNGNIDGFSIIDNEVHDNDNIGIDCIGWEGTAGGSQGDDDSNGNAAVYGGHHPNDRARNGTISGNHVYRCSTEAPVKNPTYPQNDFSAGGIYVDGGRDITIERNVVYECDIGIDIGCEHAGVDDGGQLRDTRDVLCRDNVVYYCGQAGVSIGGYNKFRGPAVDCEVINNTVYKCSSLSWGGGQITFAKCNDNLVSNNVLVARGLADTTDYDGYHNTGSDWTYDHGVMIGSTVNAVHNFQNVLDHNLYYTADGLANVFWKWQMGPDKDPIQGFSGLAAIDANAIFGDPAFIHGTLGQSDGQEDFRLSTASSPAVDSGDTSLSDLGSLDAAGLLRVAGPDVDRGAYEWNSIAP